MHRQEEKKMGTMRCIYCGVETGMVLVNILNTRERTPVCKNCQPGVTVTETETEISTTICVPVDLEEIAQQVNPDISCDFCNQPDPQWVYDLRVKGLSLGIDLGTRWTACDPCALAADSYDIEATVRRLGPVTPFVIQIHTKVMEGLSNKRPYDRDLSDGVLKKI